MKRLISESWFGDNMEYMEKFPDKFFDLAVVDPPYGIDIAEWDTKEQKPIELYRWILTNYAKEGDKILDTHLGSQSSRIAAYDLGFDFYGCELDTDYFKEGNERFETNKKKFKGFFQETVINNKIQLKPMF